MRTHLIRTLAVIAVIALLIVIGVYAITETDWGRERVRVRLQSAIQSNSHGVVRIGRISGNLLKGFTVHNLSVTDSSGAPFLTVDSLTTTYGLNNLRKKHIELDDLSLPHNVAIVSQSRAKRSDAFTSGNTFAAQPEPAAAMTAQLV